MTPLDQLQVWLREATRAGEEDADTMALATATADGAPSVRYVSLRGVDGEALRFFTNLESRKGTELAANPRAAAVFFWRALGRQARVEGVVAPLDADESNAYFATRARSHQLAACASPQSKPLDHPTLLQRYAELEQQCMGREIPRPPSWGGFRLSPTAIEFWQRHPDRLHRRVLWVRAGEQWVDTPLAP